MKIPDVLVLDINRPMADGVALDSYVDTPCHGTQRIYSRQGMIE